MSNLSNFEIKFGALASKLKEKVTTAAELDKTQPGDEFGVVARLQRKFGLGQQPRSRLALYQLLAQLATKHGDSVLTCISEAVAQSVSARFPDRYFCSVVVKMLKEKGLMKAASEEDKKW